MKKHLVLTILAASGLSCLGASLEYDITAGTTFTGASNISGSLLDQAFAMATVKSGKGLVIASDSVPDVQANRRYTNYIWLDLNYSPPYLKQWIKGVVSSNWNYATNWETLTVPNGTVTSNKLADFAVTSSKIATNAIDSSYMIASNTINSGHILEGTIQSNDIASLTINNGQMADGSLTGSKMSYRTLDGSHVVWPFMTNALMYDNSVLASVLNLSNLLATNILNGSNIITRSIPSNTVTLRSIYGVNDIALYSIVSSNIATNAIQGYQISADAITNISRSLAKSYFGRITNTQAWYSAEDAGHGSGYSINTPLAGQGLFLSNYLTSSDNWSVYVVLSNPAPNLCYYAGIDEGCVMTWYKTSNYFPVFMNGTNCNGGIASQPEPGVTIPLNITVIAP